MRYNVAQLLKEPTGSTRVCQLDETFTGASRIADGARGPVRLLRTHQGVLAQAELDVQVTLTCSRCLAPFVRPTTIAIEEEFFPLVDISSGRRLPAAAADEGGVIDMSHNLDLSDVLRQSVITDEPMKPLCAPECAGLCQVCGANLNQAQCDCSHGPMDPRWEGLAALLRQDST